MHHRKDASVRRYWGLVDGPDSEETAQDIALAAVGARCWRARRGHGSFLTFDFGDRISDRAWERGAWHLWVYFGEWKLTDGTRVTATNWDGQQLIEEAVARFSGTRLVDVVVDAHTLDSVFEFEHQLRLAIGPNTDEEVPDADWWLLFTPGERVLVAGPGPTWSYRSAHEPR
jgi:hypothetical protein